MKLFDNWLYNKLKHMWENRHLYESDSDAKYVNTMASPRHPRDEAVLHMGRSNGLSFQIYGASGGYVLECSSYDEKTDRHQQNLHIISSDADFGDAISKIITIEMLKR
jgi:hypothetical protein